MQNAKFGRLLKGAINSIATYESKTAPIIEDELGQQIGLSAATIQRYKAGHVPPELQTVQVLAGAALKRGYLNREWLQDFLAAAHHPAPESVLTRYFPAADKVATQQPQRIYHNLPAPSYSQFVRREQAWAEVMDGLGQRSSAVVITSLGGMGKTSLAREVAADSLGLLPNSAATPRFEAVVWVSDKDHPGLTTLGLVLDEIARTLDYPGFTQYSPADKQREVEQLLRRRRVLLVVDNFETVEDTALVRWLLRLPEPSKALITTREYRREFRRGAWPVELHGMSRPEAHQLIEQRLRQLKIERLAAPTQFNELIEATGGNAKAIEMALGCIKYERRSLTAVLADLTVARSELFEDLFDRAWQLLDEPTRRVWLAMPLFPTWATQAALSATAAVDPMQFEAAIERLTDLTLLDAHQPALNAPPCYTLHPLARVWVGARLAEQPTLEADLRHGWLAWYTRLAAQVGYCWQELERLELLDPEQDTLQAVLRWTLDSGLYAQTLALTKGVGYYYYVRGLWERKPPINLMGVEAARKLGDRVEEAAALAFHLQLLCKQGNLVEVEAELPRLEELAATEELPPDTFFMYRHTLALYHLARQEWGQAEAAWRSTLPLAQKLPCHLQIVNRQWLGLGLYRQGRLDEACQLFEAALHDALDWNYRQGQVALQILLATVALDQHRLDQAEGWLADSFEQSVRYQYRDHLAQLHWLYARFYRLKGDEPAALAALDRAIDLFERLGMRTELTEARDCRL